MPGMPHPAFLYKQQTYARRRLCSSFGSRRELCDSTFLSRNRSGTSNKNTPRNRLLQSAVVEGRVVSQHVWPQRLVRNAGGLVRSSSHAERLHSHRFQTEWKRTLPGERPSIWIEPG